MKYDVFYDNELFHTSIGFDMRAPDFGAPAPDIYAAARGIDKVDFQEHHCSEDGYLPTPFLMGAAAAARTKRIGIVLGAVLLPLHDPVKIAEMIAVSDLMCTAACARPKDRILPSRRSSPVL